MIRHTIEDSHFTIIYGYDEFACFFLSVFDNRVIYEESLKDLKTGFSGGCFDLHTGFLGFGQRVSLPTLLLYMEKYGISRSRINDLMSEQRTQNADYSLDFALECAR
jgi:hypothetical protein